MVPVVSNRLACALVLALALCGVAFAMPAPAVLPPAEWQLARRASGRDIVHIIVAVAQENTGFLERTLAAVSDPDSPQYGQYVPLDTLATLVHGRADAVEAVEATLDQARTWHAYVGLPPRMLLVHAAAHISAQAPSLYTPVEVTHRQACESPSKPPIILPHQQTASPF